MNKILQISIINTIRMNWHYFGVRGLLHLYILASRNVKILRMKGNIKFTSDPHLGSIMIGFPHTGIFDKKYERAIWDNVGSILVGGDIRLYQGARISNSGNIIFSGDFTMGNSTVVCEKEISFGSNVMISWDDLIMDTDFHKIMEIENPEQVINLPSKVTIGDHTWIGCRAMILKGTYLANNTVVAAGSVISKDVTQENTIVGDTNKILRKIFYGKNDKRKEYNYVGIQWSNINDHWWYRFFRQYCIKAFSHYRYWRNPYFLSR